MTIKRTFWFDFKSYLYIDRKLSDKPGSVSADKSRFNKIANYFIDKDFNRDNFNIFIGTLKDQNYTASYINNIIKVAKHLDRWLKINELRDYTFFRTPPKVNYDILTPDEIKALANVEINYAKHKDYINQRQRCLILILGTTGCRIGEALGLKFSDLYSNPPHVIFRNTKNGDDRQVVIGQELFAFLTTLAKKSEFIFVSGRGGKLDHQQVNLDLKIRAKKVGIKKRIWAHLMRHSYITQMLEVGVDSTDLAVIIGHHDLRTLLRYKNSLLSHYVDIVHLHPLLKREMPWASSVKNLKGFINKSFDATNHTISITEGADDISVSIKRN